MPSPAASSPAHRPKLRLGGRILAGVIFTASTGYWAAQGAHTGWSMNRIPVRQTDEITGIAYVTYREGFVPGLEWLAGAVALAALLTALSFIPRFQPSTPTQ